MYRPIEHSINSTSKGILGFLTWLGYMSGLAENMMAMLASMSVKLDCTEI
jgi:hypothetical protein